MTTLADRIRESRLAAGIQEPADLARRIGVRPASAYYWEDGSTKSLKGETLIALASELGVSARWLMTGKGPVCDESVNLGREPQSQAVKLDPGTMLSALRYLDRRFTEAGQRFDPFLDADLLCWAYEVESVTDAPPNNVIDFGREVAKRLNKGDVRNAKGGAG